MKEARRNYRRALLVRAKMLGCPSMRGLIAHGWDVGLSPFISLPTPYNRQRDMLTLRPAIAEDVPHILAFIRELAEYEREPDAVIATEVGLLRDGFPSDESKVPRRFHALIAEWQGEPVGFALYFYSYSTWEGRAGIYLEDIFVRPEFRGKGIGKALLTKVAAIAVAEGCARFEWSVLDWNQPAIDFYHSMGAVMKSEWRGMRVDGDALASLAALSVTEVVGPERIESSDVSK